MGRHRTRPVGTNARSFEALRAWPTDALGFLHDAFEKKRVGAGLTWAGLLDELRARYGVTWNDSSLSRYYSFWEERLRIEQTAHEEAVAMARMFMAQPTADNEVLLAQMYEHARLVALSHLGQADPAEVVKIGIAQDRLKLQREQLAIDQRKLDMLERRIAVMEQRAGEAAQAVDALTAKKQLSPEDLAEIRERLYGITAAA